MLIQLNSKSVRTRQGISNFLLDMSLSMADSLAEHLPALMPHVLKNLGDKENTSIRINTLQMLRRMFRGARMEQF